MPRLGSRVRVSFSAPFSFEIFAEIAQLVEHNLAKVRVASSSLVFRSQEKATQVVFSFFYAFFLQEIFCISVAGIMRNLIYLRLQLRK